MAKGKGNRRVDIKRVRQRGKREWKNQGESMKEWLTVASWHNIGQKKGGWPNSDKDFQWGICRLPTFYIIFRGIVLKTTTTFAIGPFSFHLIVANFIKVQGSLWKFPLLCTYIDHWSSQQLLHLNFYDIFSFNSHRLVKDNIIGQSFNLH